MNYKLIGLFEPQSYAETLEARNNFELLQSVVVTLEAHKRAVGRRLSRTDKYAARSEYFELAQAYNNIENQIAFMCDVFHVDRISKPYKIKLEDL